MVDKLIQAYRAQIYDRDMTDYIAIFKNKWKILLATIGPIILFFMSMIFAIIRNWVAVVYIMAFVEIIYVYFLDRYLVKHYQDSLRIREEHLEKVQWLLSEFTTKKDLCAEHDIKKIIDRLSQKIESQDPVENLFGKFGAFVKNIILPVITFFAGISSTWLEKMEIERIINIAVMIIVFLGVGYIVWTLIVKFLNVVVKMDYNAAKSLREDLEDILLFGSIEKAE